MIEHFPFPPAGETSRFSVLVTRKDYPAPLLTSEDPAPGTAFPTVAGLLQLAVNLGWQGRITWACGYVPHATLGTPGKTAKESQAVRLTRGDQRAVAVRMGGNWESLWTWAPYQFFVRHATLELFKEALR